MNNKTANDLLNLIVEVKRAQGGVDREMAYPFASGVLSSIMDWARNSSDRNDLQKDINSAYSRYEKDLQDLQKTNNETSAKGA